MTMSTKLLVSTILGIFGLLLVNAKPFLDPKQIPRTYILLHFEESHNTLVPHHLLTTFGNEALWKLMKTKKNAILWKSLFFLKKNNDFQGLLPTWNHHVCFLICVFWWRKSDAIIMKKRYFSIKKSIRNDDDPKSDKKHLQTRFPTPSFVQQMRF